MGKKEKKEKDKKDKKDKGKGKDKKEDTSSLPPSPRVGSRIEGTPSAGTPPLFLPRLRPCLLVVLLEIRPSSLPST